MHIFFHHYWFLVLSGFIAGFVDAIAGGGGLISLPALVFYGVPFPAVLGTNKLQSVIGTSTASINYYRGGIINLQTVWRGLVWGLVGAVCGTITVNHISDSFMRYLLPFMMLLILIVNLGSKSFGIIPGKQRLTENVFFSVFGFILGFYDAFFGPGTGNFWIISIVYFLGYNFLQASGYSKVLNLKSNLFALALFMFYGDVEYKLGLIMACGQIAGSYLGAKSVLLKGAAFIKPVFTVIVLVNIVVAIYQIW